LTQEQQKDWLRNILKRNKMAHIKEPEGVDFQIQSPPLTDKERKEISELIKKMKNKTKTIRKRISRKRNTTKEVIE